MNNEGFFGPCGGCYVAEVLHQPLLQLKDEFESSCKDRAFQDELSRFYKDYIGRPTPLLPAVNSSRQLGGAKISIKLEGLANTGAHKINRDLSLPWNRHMPQRWP